MKTRPTKVSPTAYVKALANDAIRGDSQKLMKIMAKVTRKRPKMWGPSIVGYGSYHYRYESGREGDMPMIGFAPRGRELVVYIMPGFGALKNELAQLGKHRKGKSCLYIRSLDGIDVDVLERILRKSVAEMERRYG